MPSNVWRMLGTADILGHLRADLKTASSTVWIVGPWIDGFFAQVVLDVVPDNVELRVITRPTTGASPSFSDHALSARSLFIGRRTTYVRLLDDLHAKLVVIDDKVVYCGSANWYRYSLQESRELVLRGPAEDAVGLLDELCTIWELGSAGAPLSRPVAVQEVSKGYRAELVDPIAEAKLKEVPGSFIIRRPHSK